MKQITVRIPTRVLAEIERDARDAGTSRSEHIRDVLESRRDAPADAPNPERVRDLEQQLAKCQRDLERVRNEKKVLVDAYQTAEQTQELVEYVEEQQAGVVGRAKRWLFGGE